MSPADLDTGTATTPADTGKAAVDALGRGAGRADGDDTCADAGGGVCEDDEDRPRGAGDLAGAVGAAGRERGSGRAVWALLIGTLLSRAAGFAYPLLAFHAASVGLSDRAVGVVLAVFGVGWLVGQLCAGWLTDALGYRTVLALALVVGAVELPLLAVAHDPVTLAVVSLGAGLALDATRPAVGAAIADLVPDEKQRATVNGRRLGCINIGAAAAAAAGGLLYDTAGYAVLCWTNSFALVAFAVIAVPWLGTAGEAGPRGTRPRPDPRPALADRPLWLLCAASVGSMTCAVALVTTLPMMIAADGLPGSAYGWTQVVHVAGVVALTPLLTPYVSRRAGDPRGLLRVQAATSVALAVGAGAAGFADATWAYAVAVLVAVPGEVAWYIAAGEMLDVIAPPDARGTYHGLWGTCFAISAIVAPLATGWAMDAGGSAAAGVVVLCCGLSGALLCHPLRTAVAVAARGPAAATVASRSAEAARALSGPHGTGLVPDAGPVFDTGPVPADAARRTESPRTARSL